LREIRSILAGLANCTVQVRFVRLALGCRTDLWHALSDISDALRNDQAELAQETANLIDLRGTCFDEYLPNAM